jgi:mono/diheme cytochrome c family protein
MKTRVLTLLLLLPCTAVAQDQRPADVTDETIAEGKTLYNGAGLCMACHGPTARGIPNLGADLTDSEWLHSDGTFEGILETIVQGVGPDASSTGAAMPPGGGGRLSEAQLRAVTAYVWSLTHEGSDKD